MDSRYFEAISGVSKWNIDFVVYKRGGKEIVGVSYYAVIQSRSVTCELQLEAGEYIIFVSFSIYFLFPLNIFLKNFYVNNIVNILLKMNFIA